MVGGIFRLSDRYLRPKPNHHSDHHSRWMPNSKKNDNILGILSFDIAKSMCRIVCLYKSLSNSEMLRLRKHVIRGRGITFLTSNNDGFLLMLACAERLEELDHVASMVSLLGRKCSDYGLVRFDQVYMDLKNGLLDIRKLNVYGSKEMQKNIEKMGRFTSLTGELYMEIEELMRMETSEKRLNDWKKNSKDHVVNYNLFDNKIVNQRKLVRQLKEVSLWNQTYDKIVGLMAKMVCVLYARICALFRPHISYMLPNNSSSKFERINKIVRQRLFNDVTPTTTMSGPISNSCFKKSSLVRFLSRDNIGFNAKDVKLRLGLRNYSNHLENNKKVFQAAPPSTVGGSGLATRYANIILLSERYFKAEAPIGDLARHTFYNLLPLNLKTQVRSKLRVVCKERKGEMCNGDEMAERWRKAVADILTWLVPVAQDTIAWQAERNMEKQSFDSRPTVLLLQTLHYADIEKTKAAIVEVLVGLSCIYMYENRRIVCEDIY